MGIDGIVTIVDINLEFFGENLKRSLNMPRRNPSGYEWAIRMNCATAQFMVKEGLLEEEFMPTEKDFRTESVAETMRGFKINCRLYPQVWRKIRYA